MHTSVFGAVLAAIALCLFAMSGWFSRDRGVKFACVTLSVIALVVLVLMGTGASMTLLLRVPDLGLIRRGYAVAWYVPTRREAVCLPVGLHAVASWVRATYLRVCRWHSTDIVEAAYQEGAEAARAAAVRQQSMRARDEALALLQARRLAFQEGYRHALNMFEADLNGKPDPPVPVWFKDA